MYPIKQSTAITVPFFVHDANGDAVTALTDGSFTKRISKGSAAFGAMTVTISEMENGWYSIPLSTTHSNTLGLLSITFTNAGAKQVNLQFRVEATLIDDLNDVAATDIVSAGAITTSSGAVSTVTTLTGHTAQTGDSFARLGAPAGASVSADIATVDTVVDGIQTDLDNATDGLGAIKAETALIVADTNELQTDDVPGLIAALNDVAATDIVSAGAITTLAGAVVNVDLVDTCTTNTDMVAAAPTAASVADAIWDEDATAHQTTGTFGQAIGDPVANTKTLYAALVTDATGASVTADVATAQADLDTITGADGVNLLSATQASVDAIEADTNELQTDNVPGLIATAQADLDIITGVSGVNLLTATQASIDAIEADTNELQTDDIPTLIAALNDISTAEVLTQVNSALDTAIAELGVAAPTATPTLRTGLMLLYMMARNKLVVQTSGTDAIEVYNDAGTKIAAKAITDDGSDYTEAEMA